MERGSKRFPGRSGGQKRLGRDPYIGLSAVILVSGRALPEHPPREAAHALVEGQQHQPEATAPSFRSAQPALEGEIWSISPNRLNQLPLGGSQHARPGGRLASFRQPEKPRPEP
jgi:hypothetical protein